MMLRFTFEDKTYEVSDNVYWLDAKIQLPDGRVLEPLNGWIDDIPPKPRNLAVVDRPRGHVFEATTV